MHVQCIQMPKTGRGFEDLIIYSDSIEGVKQIYKLSKIYPLSRDLPLTDQLRRASISIPANIAEGYGKHTKKDFAGYLSIAMGSANEVVALLDVTGSIYEKINIKELRQFYKTLSKKIYSFRRHIQSA